MRRKQEESLKSKQVEELVEKDVNGTEGYPVKITT